MKLLCEVKNIQFTAENENIANFDELELFVLCEALDSSTSS
jgi:hypothetical protein